MVDIGIWGTRGERRGGLGSSGRTNSTMTAVQEVDYYLDWIQTTFPKSKIVYVYDRPLALPRGGHIILQRLSRVIQQQQQQQRAQRRNNTFGSLPDSVVIRKDLIMAKMPKNVPCVHGCGGPVTMTVATLFIDYIAESLAPPRNDDDDGLCEV